MLAQKHYLQQAESESIKIIQRYHHIVCTNLIFVGQIKKNKTTEATPHTVHFRLNISFV